MGEKKHALHYYTISSPCLFMMITSHATGCAISFQRLSKWITQYITLCWQIYHSLWLSRLTWWGRNSILCLFPKCGNLLMLLKHYALDLAAKFNARLGKAVLQSLFDWLSWYTALPSSWRGYCLPVTYSRIHYDTYSKKTERLLYSNCGSSSCSLCGYHYLPSIPTFRVPS